MFNPVTILPFVASHMLYVTGFRKTDHVVTIDIARNTDLKY